MLGLLNHAKYYTTIIDQSLVILPWSETVAQKKQLIIRFDWCIFKLLGHIKLRSQAIFGSYVEPHGKVLCSSQFEA